VGVGLNVNKLLSGIAVTAGVMGLVLLPGQALMAEQTQSERARIMAEIDKDIHNDEALQNAILAGKDRSVLCGHCHGVDGNSVKPDIPNLAGQNTAYIVEQIGKFANGDRKDFVMQTLANNFTFTDKVNLALYFNSQKVKGQEYDADLAARGERIYKHVCFRCHGEDGKGEEGYARLAGQKIGYVELTLQRFRSTANKEETVDGIKRTNASMEQVTARLSDDEIKSLAHYISQLK
jgi:cytochrome c553